MQPKRGVATGKFGRWLAEQVSSSPRSQGYVVYYDHGDKSADPRVAAVKGFLGDEVTNENRLADVDVIIAKPDGEAVLLVEIEEREASPKKLLGDVFAILMCNRFAVGEGDKQRYFVVTPDTELIVAAVVSERGQKLKKVENVIRPRLEEFQGPDDGVQMAKISLELAGELPNLIEQLKERMRQRFS